MDLERLLAKNLAPISMNAEYKKFRSGWWDISAGYWSMNLGAGLTVIVAGTSFGTAK
jgi:hypothetical protein